MGDKGDVPGEPVELSDDKPRLQPLAGAERGDKLRPVAAFAALNLYKFVSEAPLPAVEEVEHGLALPFEAKAALSLPVSRDAKVGNPFAAMFRHISTRIMIKTRCRPRGWGPGRY